MTNLWQYPREVEIAATTEVGSDARGVRRVHEGEEDCVEVTAREVAPKSVPAAKTGLDLDARLQELRLHQAQDLLTHGEARRRHEAQRQPLAAAGVDAVAPAATACPLEQAARLCRSKAIPAPVCSVEAVLVQEDRAVERAQLGVDLVPRSP